jgi:ligand-binding sensor protein
MDELDHLVPVSLLRQIEFNLSENMGFTIVFERLDGSIITQEKPYESRPFKCKSCQLLARYPAGFAECQNSDTEACHIVAKNRTPLLYICKGNFSNFAIPLKVEGKVIACMFGGQLLVLEPRDKLEKELFNPLKLLVKEEPGKDIKGGFFYHAKELNAEQIRKIAKERGLDDSELAEFQHAYEIDLSLKGGRVITVRKFIKDFRTLEVVAETLSSYAQEVLKLKREFGPDYKLPPKPAIPIDIPPDYTVLFKFIIPQGKLSPDERRLKELEIDVLNSTLLDEVRRYLAKAIAKMPERVLDPEMKKFILRKLGKRRSKK